MAKPRSLLADYVVYLVVRLLVCVMQALSLAEGPLRWQPGLAWLAYRSQPPPPRRSPSTTSATPSPAATPRPNSTAWSAPSTATSARC